jgi:CheY-like chemotaxis protein
VATIAYLVPDLLFASKIRETARQLGHTCVPCRTAQAVLSAAPSAALVLLDLGLPDALPLLRRLREDPAARRVPVAGFVEHARVEVIHAARELDCRALSRGKFTAELPAILAALPPLVE